MTLALALPGMIGQVHGELLAAPPHASACNTFTDVQQQRQKGGMA